MTDTATRQRRQRAVLSCNDCRRRKLACDRGLPCSRCIKGNIADKCAYSSTEAIEISANIAPNSTIKRQLSESTQADLGADNGSTPRKRVGPSEMMRSDISPQDHLNSLQRQVDRLEKALDDQSFSHSRRISNHFDRFKDQQAEQPKQQAGLLKGRHYATFFYGPSSSMADLAHFPDLRSFMKEIYQNSRAQRLAQDLKEVERREDSNNSARRVLSIQSLRDLLPDRATVDSLVETYLGTFETTYRIVHLPTFRASYEDFWNDETRQDTDMEALVLAMLACAACTSPHEVPRYYYKGSTLYNKAVLWIKGCEAWLKRQSNKHRTLASLQVRCMRLIALATITYKRKEYYQEVQTHMAFMRSSGMHRDPAIAGNRCSQFEGEMRRRLWATSVELELQASIDKGTPSVLSGLESDCAAPRNIDDALLQVDTEDLPDSQSEGVFTDSSYLHLSTQSLKLRIELCSVVNSLQRVPTFSDCLRYGDMIEKCLRTLPVWEDSRALQSSALLNLQLRQFLTILHTPRALKIEPAKAHEFGYSVIIALESASTLTTVHESLSTSANFALCCMRNNDYLRAALLICHIAYHASESKTQIAKATFDNCLEKALRLRNELVIRLGRGGHAFWYLSAAYSLVSMRYNPLQSATFKLQAVDRVSKLFYTMLSLLDEPNEQSMASEVTLENVVPAFPQLNATLSEPLSTRSFTDAGLQFDPVAFSGSSDWMLDDFWFLDNAQPVAADDQTNMLF
ncbi:hypothetical protein T440DRAFT_273668 [Plenodomus tracheiphilus IPT5]|uniref:Zn(2)-C6 fungal-type domain-containing protein n=1 Tax=Plenodomus tracheiphilus IPT5 TaxID=1408161 RepID=A0A6A7BGI1_9PLEO|nr:hypothetical protein T440DRAFT_273668 [Plenodomus tracheiphilus IPT5]